MNAWNLVARARPWLVGIGFGFMLASGPATAQIVLETEFERDVNRYRWSGLARADVTQGPWVIGMQNAFRSDAYLLFDNRLSFRDENRFKVDAVRLTDGLFSPTVRSTADWFSLSRVYHQDAWVGLRHTSHHGWWMEPAAGLVIDARPGALSGTGEAPVRTDGGPAAGLSFGLPQRDLGGYATRLEGQVQLQRMSPRAGRVVRLRAETGRTFARTSVRANVEVASLRRDAYQAASFLNRDEAALRRAETVESTVSDTLQVGIDISTMLTEGLDIALRVDAGLNARKVRSLRAPSDALVFDSDFGRQTVRLDLATRWQFGSGYVRAGMNAGAEVEERQLDNAADLPPAQAVQKLTLLRQADYDRGFMGLTLMGLVPLSRRVTAQFDGSANLLQHDTPEVNPDDRDELLYNGSVGLEYRVSRTLTFSTRAFGSWFHTVYLRAARSADNNTQRSIRLRPSLSWQPSPNTAIRLESEVRATYTVDDFLLPGRRPTDQSAREMRYQLEAEQAVGGGLRLKVDAAFSDLRLGRFLADEFAEIPFDTLRTWSGWVRLQTGGRVTAEIGLRYFIRSDYDRSATVSYGDDRATITRPGRRRIDQIGPTTTILWPMRKGTSIRLDGWAVVQRVSTRLYGVLPEEQAPTIRRAADRGTRSLIPNLTVSMLVYF